MRGNRKLVRSILDSYTWCEGDATRRVWITLLVMADNDGIVDSSLLVLAWMVGMEIPDLEKSLQVLEPRIEAIDGGWRILNHAKYRSKMDSEENDMDRDENAENLLELCESPIEKRFLKTFMVNYPGVAVTLSDGIHWLHQGFKDDFILGFDLRVYPQFTLEIPHFHYGSNDLEQKKYRADFLFRLIGPYSPFSHTATLADQSVHNLIVEVDGHDFHEKTKEQAARDKRRDRDMVSSGYSVMRFTGSEVASNCDELIKEVTQSLYLRSMEVIKTHNLKQFIE